MTERKTMSAVIHGESGTGFIDATGTGHIFPFVDDDEKKALVAGLTGGIVQATPADLKALGDKPA